MKLIYTFISILIFISFQAKPQYQFQDSGIANNYAAFKPKPFTPKHLSGFDESYANWSFELKIQELKNKNVLKNLAKNNISIPENLSVLFNNGLPQNINRIRAYGNSNKRSGDINVFFYGDFTDESILNLITSNLYVTNEESNIEKVNTIISGKFDIVVFNLKKAINKHKKLYSTRMQDGSYLLSTNVRNVRAILRKPYEKEDAKLAQINDSTNLNDLAIFRIRKPKTTIDSNKVDSQLFNKANKITAILREEERDISLGGFLLTENETMAIQIERILNGISAIKSLNSDDKSPIAAILFRNLLIERDEETVYFKTKFNLGSDS